MPSSGYIFNWVFGPKPGVKIKLKCGLLCIGRGKEDEKRYGWLLLPDPTVSRHHANLHWLPDDHRFLLEHLSQTNPSLVNGKPVNGTQLLAHGALIQIGFSKFVLERQVINMGVITPLSKPSATADDDGASYTLQALPNGYTQSLDRNKPNLVGLGVLVVWSPAQGRFMLNGREGRRATVARAEGTLELAVDEGSGPIALESGDLISVDFCQYRIARCEPASQEPESDDTASLELARLYELPGFKFVARLGAGTSGEVVHMERVASRGSVAVKFLRPHLVADPVAIKRFHQEAKVALALDHPALLRVLEAGLAPNGRPFLVSELLLGETLAERLKAEGGLAVPEAVRICKELAQGLDLLHGRSLVHRDVKPDNIFLRADGRGTVLMDFGIVRGSDLTTATGTGFAMGTPSYMAPEQFRGYPQPSSDQYALGAVLFEALAGRKVFESDDAFAQGYMHVHQQPPHLSSLNPAISPAISRVVGRMLSKVPEARYPTVGAAVAELQKAAAQHRRV